MNSKVCVDASFVLKLVLPEDHSPKVHLLWTEWIKEGYRIYSTYLLVYETHSVIRNKVHRGEIEPDEGTAASDALRELEVILYHSPLTVKIAWEFAQRYSRPTLYDSFYLAVAKEVESEFWTADRKLLNSLKMAEVPWVRSVFDAG